MTKWFHMKTVTEVLMDRQNNVHVQYTSKDNVPFNVETN